MRARNLMLFLLFSIRCLDLGGQSFFSQGEKFLVANNPKEALVFLEAALAQKEGDPEQVLLYLGLAYDKVGQVQQALRAFTQGAALKGPKGYLHWFNLAGLHLRQGNWAEATSALVSVLGLNPAYTPAILNLANAYLSLGKWQESYDQYERYLSLEASSPQRPQVTQVMELIKARIAKLEEEKRRDEAIKLAEAARLEREDQERKELAALEEKKREEVRIAQEKAAAEEEERQKLVLERIRQSLSGVGSAGQSLGAGAAGIQEFREEFTLDE